MGAGLPREGGRKKIRAKKITFCIKVYFLAVATDVRTYDSGQEERKTEKNTERKDGKNKKKIQRRVVLPCFCNNYILLS